MERVYAAVDRSRSQSTWTLPLGVQMFAGQYTSDHALILAYTVIAVLPAVIFYAFAERQIVAV